MVVRRLSSPAALLQAPRGRVFFGLAMHGPSFCRLDYPLSSGDTVIAVCCVDQRTVRLYLRKPSDRDYPSLPSELRNAETGSRVNVVSG